jgi:hypothetical protein
MCYLVGLRAVRDFAAGFAAGFLATGLAAVFWACSFSISGVLAGAPRSLTGRMVSSAVSTGA